MNSMNVINSSFVLLGYAGVSRHSSQVCGRVGRIMSFEIQHDHVDILDIPQIIYFQYTRPPNMLFAQLEPPMFFGCFVLMDCFFFFFNEASWMFMEG